MDQQMKVFNVGQEVEAKFNSPGFRGAWFSCRILEIKDGRGDPNCLLEYLDFDEEAPTWHKARQPAPASKPKYWTNEKTLHWVIRPAVPAVIPEGDLEDFKRRAALQKKEVNVVALFNNQYMVGDMVEWWEDEAWWTGRITELSKTKKGAELVTLVLPSLPHGEGLTCEGIETSKLRPAFSWSRQNQWNWLIPKIPHKRAVTEEKLEKPRVQIVYLPGGSGSLLNPQQCDSRDLGPVHSSHQSESTTVQSEFKGHRHLASLHSECTSEKRQDSSDLTDLVATLSTPYSSNGSGAHEVGKSDCSTSVERRKHRSISLSQAMQDTHKEKGRRRNLCKTTSFYLSDSDSDELEQSAAALKPPQCSTKMGIAIVEDTEVHVNVPGHDGEDKDSGMDTKGTIPTNDNCPPDVHEDTVETSSEKLVKESSLPEMSLLRGDSTKTRVISCKKSSNMEESLVCKRLGNMSVEVYLPTETLMEDGEEPQSGSVKETLLGDMNSHQILAEDACREVGDIRCEMEMSLALDSKCETIREVVITNQLTARQIFGSPGSSEAGNASCSGRADAERCEVATTLVNSEDTNKVDDVIGENIRSNTSSGTQSSRRTQPSLQVLEPSITTQPTKQKQRATKLQENEFRLKTVKKARLERFWKKRKCPRSETDSDSAGKRLRMGGSCARIKIPAINRAGSIQNVVLPSAPSTPVYGENREFRSGSHYEWDVAMEEANNKHPMTEEAELVGALEIKSGECEVSVAPLQPRLTAIEGDKGRVTSSSSLQECSEKVAHVLVDSITTTEPGCKEPAFDKSDLYPAEKIPINDNNVEDNLEAELDALERLTERIDGLKLRVMRKQGKRKRAAKLSRVPDGNKRELRDDLVSTQVNLMVCGEPPVKKMCASKMELPTGKDLDLKDSKTELADSTGSMEKGAGAMIEIPRMRGALNMKGQRQITNQENGRKRSRKNTTPTKIPVPLKAEVPEGPQVQLDGNAGREGKKGINLSDGPVAFELEELEQRVPMRHQKKELGGQRSRSETTSNVDPSSVSKQEEPALNSSKTLEKLRIEETHSVEHMRLSPLRETPEGPFPAADSLPKVTQAGSDGLLVNPGVNSVAAQAVKVGKATKLREGISGAGTTSSSLPNVKRVEKEGQVQVFHDQKGASESVCGGIRDKQRTQFQSNPVIQGNMPATTSCKGASDKRTGNCAGLEDLSARLHRSIVTLVDQRVLESPRTVPILTLAGQQPPLRNAGEVFRAGIDTDSTKCNQKEPLVSTEVHERSCTPMPSEVISEVISGAEIILPGNNGKKVKQENQLGTAVLRFNEVLVQSPIENSQSMCPGECQPSESTGVLEGLDKLKDEFHSASQRPFKTPIQTVQEQAAVDEAGTTLWQSIHCWMQDPPIALQGQTMLKRLKVISEMLKISDHVDDPVGNTKKVVLRACNSEEIYIGVYKTEPEAIAVCSMISRCQRVIREFLASYKKSSTLTMELPVTSHSGETQLGFGQRVGHPVPSTSSAPSNNRVQNSISSAGVQNRSEVLNMQTPRPVETVTASQIAGQPWRQNYPGVHTATHSVLQPTGAGNIYTTDQVSTGIPTLEQLTARNQVQDVSVRLGGFTNQAPASLPQANNSIRPPQNRDHAVNISIASLPQANNYIRPPQNRDHAVNISITAGVERPYLTPNHIIVLDDDNDDEEDACRIMPPQAPIMVNPSSRTSRGHNLEQAGSVHSGAFPQVFPQVQFGGSPGCGDGLQCSPHAPGVTGPTRGIPANRHAGEVGRGSMSVPCTNMTGGQTISTKRLYSCCMGTEATKLDYILIRALHCDLCDWLMHTECAILQRKLALKRFNFNGEEHEQIIYTCNCNKAWGVLPSLLSRIKYFMDFISRKQKLSNSQAGGLVAPVSVVEMNYVRELLFKMQQMLEPTQGPILRYIHTMVSQMLVKIYTNPNAVNFQGFVVNIDDAVDLMKGTWIPPSRTMLPTTRVQ